MPRLDIVIVNWNAGRQLQDCLDGVFASELGELQLGRVVVVDNASVDGSADGLVGPSDILLIQRNPTNLGFAAACNQGAAGSDADYLLFLNPDMRLDPDSLAASVAFMEAPAQAEVAVTGLRLRDDAGVTQRCTARFPTPGRMVAQSIGLDRLAPQSIGLDRLAPQWFLPHFLTEWDHQETREVDQVMGAFLLIRRPVFFRLGGFDERFFLYYEDVDLCRRVIIGGDRILHNAAVSAVHIGGGTTGQIKARRQFLSAFSRIQYATKHFGWLAALPVALACLLLEPLARLAQGIARRRPVEMRQALVGGALLWAALPKLLLTRRRHKPSILLLTRYPRQGASSRTRFLAMIPALQAAGIEVTVAPFFDEDYLPRLYAGKPVRLGALLLCYGRRLLFLLGRHSFDLIWLEKEALPWMPLPFERCLLGKAPLVIDFDDAWSLRYAEQSRQWLRRLLGRKLEGLVRHAALTVVGNDHLSDWARQAGAKAILQIPTVVDLDRYQPRATAPSVGPMVVGWMGTPDAARSHLRPLAAVLNEFIAAGQLELVTVGALGVDLGVPVRELPWHESTEVDQLRQFDVGIMPLPDDPWSRGKCAYKLIQYMAAGLPVVASPVGMNRVVVAPGINGFLAATPEEWRQALRRLADDPSLRPRLGAAGRNRVAERYCLAVVAPKLTSAITAILNKAGL